MLFRLFLYVFLDDAKLVRMPIDFRVVDSEMIKPVNAHFPAGVNDVIVFHDNANMDDFTFFIVKKSKITGFTFLYETQRFTL